MLKAENLSISTSESNFFSWQNKVDALVTWPLTSHMDNGHVMRAFSKSYKTIGQFGQMARINCGVFGVFPLELSEHFLPLCVPSPWFSINQPIFLQKSKYRTRATITCSWILTIHKARILQKKAPWKIVIIARLQYMKYEFGLQRITNLAVRSPWLHTSR